MGHKRYITTRQHKQNRNTGRGLETQDVEKSQFGMELKVYFYINQKTLFDLGVDVKDIKTKGYGLKKSDLCPIGKSVDKYTGSDRDHYNFYHNPVPIQRENFMLRTHNNDREFNK